MNILFYQPAVLSEEDKVYFNGELLSENSKKLEIIEQIGSIFRGVKSTYPLVGKAKGLYVVRRLFDATDEKGRQLAFLFTSDSRDFLEELKHATAIVGYSISQSTLKSIDDFHSNQKTKQTLVIGVFSIIFLTLITYLICK